MTNKELDETLEERINTSTKSSTRSGLKKVVDRIIEGYDWAYTNYPITTKYVSTAVGTIGGDIIAKQFTENSHVSSRDIVITGVASIGYSLLAEKVMDWSNKLTDKLGEFEKYKQRVKESRLGHDIHNAVILTIMYIPVNLIYWNLLSFKNHQPISVENNLLGLATCCLTSIPYLYAEYIAITKLNNPNTRKYLRPFYSAIEIGWNILTAGGNYVAKKI